MNVVVLKGRLTKDPELRTTISGKRVVRFTLAVDRDKDNTDFILCQAWEQRADFLTKYFAKGSALALQGRIQAFSYEKEGKTEYETVVIADRIEFCEKKEERPKVNIETAADEVADDDGLPF
jgi:single-strand DNA-binding protein